MEMHSPIHCNYASTEENDAFVDSNNIIAVEANEPKSCEQKSPLLASEHSANDFGVAKCDMDVDAEKTVNKNILQHFADNFKVSANTHGQITDGVFGLTVCPNSGDVSDLSKVEIEILESFAGVINDLKVSNIQLKQTTDVLNAKYSALEKTSAEWECRNRTLERELALLQSEHDRTKRKLLQVTSDVTNFAATSESNQPKVVEEVSEKESCRTKESQNELELTKADVQKLGNEVSGITSLLKDVNDKVTWIELEFQKFMRRHSLVIENLCPKEDKSASEMFLVFAKCVLNVTIEDGDIESVHVISQLTGSPEKRPRPILVTFACYGARSRVYKAWLAFRSSKVQGPGALSGERGQGICIREYLTELQDSFYHEAVCLRDKHLIIDCWTFKGKTYIRMLDGEVKEFNKEQWISKNENATSGCNMM